MFSRCWNSWRAMRRRSGLGYWALHLCFLLMIWLCCLQNVLGQFASECAATGMSVSTSKAEAMVLCHKSDWSISGYCHAHWCSRCSKVDIVSNRCSEKRDEWESKALNLPVSVPLHWGSSRHVQLVRDPGVEPGCAREFIFLSWPWNVLRSPRRRWRKLLRKRTSRQPC